MRTKSFWNICVTISLSLLIFIGSQGFTETRQDEVVAVLNGQPIYRSEAEQNVAFKLYRLRASIYSLLKRETERIVNQKLLDKEAWRRGISVEQLLQKEVDEKIPPPDKASIDNYLASHPKEDVEEPQRRARARTYLYQSALARRKLDFLASLHQKADFKFIQQPPQRPRTRLNIQGEPWLGNPNASIILVHFSNLSSKLSAQSTQHIKKIMAEFPGQTKWVHRNFFSRFDQKALTIAQYGEWIHEQGRFWDFYDAVLALKPDYELDDIERVLNSLGLKKSDYDIANKDDRYLLKVKEDIDAAKRIGVTSVPVIFVNGLYFSGTFPYDQLKALVKKELNRKNSS